MVDLCPVVKWSSIWLVVWKPDWKKPVYVLYSNGQQSHMTLPFEYSTIQMNPVFRCLVFRWLLYIDKLQNYRGNLNSVGKWNPDTSGFQMVEKRLVCKWSWFQMGPEIRKHYTLTSRQKAAILIWKILKSSKQKCLDFQWSIFQMGGYFLAFSVNNCVSGRSYWIFFLKSKHERMFVINLIG